MTKPEVKAFDTVRYIGKWDKELCLSYGEIATVLEDYQDGNIEVDFSFPNGTTWLQCALPKKDLCLEQNPENTVFSRDYAYPLIKSFETSEILSIAHPKTTEVIEIDFDEINGNVVLSTPSLGVIMTVNCPTKSL